MRRLSHLQSSVVPAANALSPMSRYSAQRSKSRDPTSSPALAQMQTPMEYGGGLDISKEFGGIFKKVTAGLDFEFSYSVGKATAFNTITACPPNDLYNYTITWGLQDYRYVWYIRGNLHYYNPRDPLTRCSGDRDKYRGQTVPFDLYVPATQAGAKDDAAAEVQFQCCTDSRSGSYPDSPVCPNAT
ncbi:MAG: hypothetical protein Q9182_005296 [Xanthomendoza sp. 2 TL-2023]